MKAPIGFRPPERPPALRRLLRVDIANQIGHITETVSGRSRDYAWIAEDGNTKIGILCTDRECSIEELEARLQKRLR